MKSVRTVLAFAIVLVATGCGGRQPDARYVAPRIETLRERAERDPDDAGAARAVAEAELLAADGDPARAHDALARALALAPGDPRVQLVAALEADQHGRLAEALEAYLAATTKASRSSEAAAPFVAEVAIAGISQLLGQVPGFDAKVRAPLEALLAAPGALGAAASQTATDLAIELAYRRGDLAHVRQLAAARRCVTEWRVAGPFGPTLLLGFDEPHPAGAAGPMEASYDLGPGRGVRPTRTVEARGCETHLGGGPIAEGGTTYAEASIDVREAGVHLLRLETPNAVEVHVDGERVLRLDRRREALPRVTFHPVRLSAGRHELRLTLSTRHPNPAVAVSLSGPGTEDPGVPEGRGPFEDQLAVAVAMTRGDLVSAREILASVMDGTDASAALLGLRAAVALGDPLRPDTMRRDEARRALTAMASNDEAAWYAPLQLARLAAAEGRDREALPTLRDASARWPEVIAFPLTAAQLALGRGWDAEAARFVARSLDAVPDSCAALSSALTIASALDRTAEVEALVERLVACDARSNARFTQRVRTRRWQPATAELDRLASLEPVQSRPQLLSERLSLARATGDDAAAMTILRELAAAWPLADDAVYQIADRQLAAGGRDEALSTMGEALAREPGAMAALHRIRAALGGPDPLAAYRLDGLEVLRQFTASGRTYDQPSVLVLDYTVVRVFEDASALSLTHNIVRVQSEEAMDEHGEFQPPANAYLLRLRTIKADGTVLEPSLIEGKESISLPNLAIGDYVELEYVEILDAPAGLAGGILGQRFYFKSFEMPFDRSELTVVMPESFEPLVDPRGAAPRTQESVEGGLRVLRWRADESRPDPEEPGSVSFQEFVPSINWGVRATWDAFLRSLEDLLVDKDVRDPAAARLALEIAGAPDAADEESRARRIYAWVLDNIEMNADIFGPAAAMVAERTGNRSRVLHYLLRMAGIRSHLVLARSFLADQTESGLLDEEAYSHLLVVLGEGPSATFLSTDARGVPFGYVSAGLRGQDAIVLADGHQHVRIPEGSLEDDLRSVDVDVRLGEGGRARVEVSERYTGGGAIAWRNDLEGVPDALLEQRFEEAYVARIAPGASLVSLAITGRHDASGPLVLRYVFEVPSFGRAQGGRWMIPSLFPSQLAAGYATLPTRRTTEIVGPGASDIRMRLRVPPGVTLPEGPPTVTLEGPGGARFTMRSRTDGDALVVERSVRLPLMRVPVSTYPAFADFCRRADEAEAREVRIRVGR